MSSLILPGLSRTTCPELPHHIGIINDYLRIPYANGSSFASQFFYREFTRRGHAVTVLGPRDPNAAGSELPNGAVAFGAFPLQNHPGLFLALPSRQALATAVGKELDLVLAQTGSGLLDLGVWLRASAGVPLLCVNTIHLPSVYNVLLPDALARNSEVTELFDGSLIPQIERMTAKVYNMSDGLVVLCAGLEKYWRERGVRVPIHVIPRSVAPARLEERAAFDPFDPRAKRGQRLLCVCRHTREKNLERLLRLFATRILPKAPDCSLTLVGDGPDHDSFVALARDLGVLDRVFFPGEYPVHEIANFYRHADLFVYASLSETYGQVVSEALWCGLPVVALADGMGVSHQVSSGEDGVLVEPGPDRAASDQRFAEAALSVLESSELRGRFARRALQSARERSDPDLAIARYYAAFLQTRRHFAETYRPPSVAGRALPLARWAAMHTLLAGLGHLRSPAILNRHGRKQPGWEPAALDSRPMPRSQSPAGLLSSLREQLSQIEASAA